MAATAVKTPTVTSKLGEAFTNAFATVIEKLRGDAEHSTPNLGALVRATRTALGEVSQMQLGTNRGKDNKPLVAGVTTPASMAEKEKGYKKSGWFSLIANVEQGGRKTPIPAEFVTYIAKLAQVPESQVQSLVDEDTKLRTAASEANAS